MPKCEDCEAPVVFLRKPGGGWLRPVEPILDLAYGDHFIATADGTGQPMPQVYRIHECLTWEERQLKNFEREREKQRLIQEDRERREEARRQQEEFERQQREEAEKARRAREKEERKKEQKRQAARLKRFEKEVEETRELHARHHQRPELLVNSCEDCKAEAGECCRTNQYGVLPDANDKYANPWGWWNRVTVCAYRYRVGPPDDRSRIVMTERWGEDYDPDRCLGTTPDTVGPWPPTRPGNPLKAHPNSAQRNADLAGHYEMHTWLRDNYLYVFEPEKVWLQPEEEAMLTGWLAIWGDLFEEVTDGPGDVVEGRGIAGAEGAGGGHAEREGEPEAEGDRLDPSGRADAGAGDGEHADRGEGGGGTEWLRSLRP